MCGRPLKVSHVFGPHCKKIYVAMGCPVQTELEFKQPGKWDGLSILDQHKKVCQIIFK